MRPERIRIMLLRELPRHPLMVVCILLSHFSHLPIHRDVNLCAGQRMRVNLSDKSHACIAIRGDCEPEVTQMMKQVLSPGDTFIDGGANAGLKTAIGHSLVTDAGCVISVEPTPRSYRLLKHNASRWSLTAINTHQLALSDKSGKAILTDFGFRLSGLNTLGSVARDLPHLKGTPIEVKTITLDKLADGKSPSVVKLDLEGHELSALIGFQDHLAQDHPDIIFETGNPNTHDVLCLLAKFGYGFFGCVDGHITKIETNSASHPLNVLASR